MSNPTTNDVLNAVAAATNALSERKEEVNRLNVFPVPDGDTGTNMSLTMQMVVDNLAKLSIGASNAEIRKAITTGALMGARGNFGVITSQILRGLCEGYEGHDVFDTVALDSCFARAVEVSFQAVRKPIKRHESSRWSRMRPPLPRRRARRSFPSKRRSMRLSRRRMLPSSARRLPSCPEGEQRRGCGRFRPCHPDRCLCRLHYQGKDGFVGDAMSFPVPLRRSRSSKSTTGRVPPSTATAPSSSFIPIRSMLTQRRSSFPPWAIATLWSACTRTSRCMCTPTAPTRFWHGS